jgi:hypothetical protein
VRRACEKQSRFAALRLPRRPRREAPLRVGPRNGIRMGGTANPPRAPRQWGERACETNPISAPAGGKMRKTNPIWGRSGRCRAGLPHSGTACRGNPRGAETRKTNPISWRGRAGRPPFSALRPLWGERPRLPLWFCVSQGSSGPPRLSKKASGDARPTKRIEFAAGWRPQPYAGGCREKTLAFAGGFLYGKRSAGGAVGGADEERSNVWESSRSTWTGIMA